jgi:hypothetical protein
MDVFGAKAARRVFCDIVQPANFPGAGLKAEQHSCLLVVVWTCRVLTLSPIDL